MVKNYKALLANQELRMNPESVELQKAIRDELQRTPDNTIVQYIKKSMFGVDELYTRRTIEAGNKVKNQLNSKISDISFDFQGSVMTNTHIRGYSDIDLLTITEKFYTFDRSGISNAVNQPNAYFKYTQDQINTLTNALRGGGYTNGLIDLRSLRIDCENTLLNVYNNVNISRPKSIEIELTSPKRKVDVVIACWYQDTNYYLNEDKINKAIQVFCKGETAIYDKKLNADYPFKRIKLLNDKDLQVNGRLKRMIRLLKTLKYDSDQEIKLSSFDINAIIYDIDTWKYNSKSYLELIPVIYDQLRILSNNFSIRYNLKSLDGKEYIFRKEDQTTEDTEKTNSLRTMLEEIEYLLIEMQKSLRLIA
ncbi:hypothetical protein [Marinifilum sp. D737]|uniref:hypothetical protein n=1 Tax=Marinifilum sp. D737 TaxID=2969628 RepID=UPI0022769FCC|nr:hypothetical protein [Marinifilum sp. D737]MCY1633920.1 hypothetical protein [Marinifilum sp. D737]